jgi:hypothetical protein
MKGEGRFQLNLSTFASSSSLRHSRIVEGGLVFSKVVEGGLVVSEVIEGGLVVSEVI